MSSNHFPIELEQHPIDVHTVSARKPLFLDESAHKLAAHPLGVNWAGRAWR